MLLGTSYPPSGSTTLLVALGSFQTAHGALAIAIGIAILGPANEVLKLGAWRWCGHRQVIGTGARAGA